MSQTQKLLEIDYHTDSETGDNYIGEIDHGIVIGNLDRYLKSFGQEGKNAIISELAFLIYDVECRWREINNLETIKTMASNFNKP